MEPFLRDAWKNLHHHEEGHNFDEEFSHNSGSRDVIDTESDPEKESAIKIFMDLEKIAEEKGEIYKELFDSIVRAILQYVETVDRFKKARMEIEEDRTEKGDADFAKRSAHEGLINSLNIFSRFCGKNGIDNTWINMIGLDRNEIRDWALAVAGLAKKYALK